MASRIDTLISKCRSWDEFIELVNALPKTKNKEKGDLFERLTQVYLQTQPTYRSKLKNVYLLSDKTIPERLRAKLNLPDNDEGIDLVCETYSGEYWSVQCKYKSDQSAALTYTELSTFNSLSFNACKGISLGLVAHTSTKPVKKSHLMPMVNEIGLEKWLEISDADWKQIISVCRSNTLKPPKKRKPRRHQKAAISDAHNHFITKKQKRGKLIMPCGTGKSLTAYWIAQALEAKIIVVAVPSLALVRQSLADWTAEYLAEGVTPEWLAVCSDHSVGSMGDADSTVATAYEMGIPTNPTDEELDNFLKKRSKAPKVVFTTYQSAEKLCDASRRNNKTFDLLIADEAHKTVGRKSKSFATLLFDENIKVKRRLFMTATERVYNASRDDVISMDDPNIYGSICHQLSFKEAIKQKIICDYKIVTIAVSDAEINTLIQEKTELSVSAGNKTIETDAHSLAAGIAMQKAFEKYGIKHAVTFHSSIKRADNFKSQQEDLPGNSHIAHSHISSKLSAGARAKLLRGFAEEERSLITNARCLTEGVDIKAIDCVAFVDPKRSTVDIVQAAGRAMRQSRETNKDFGYIIIPLLIGKNETIENVKSSDKFVDVVKIVTSLSTQDERIKEELKFNLGGEKQPENSRIILDDDLAEMLNIDISQIEVPLKTVLWQRVGSANWVAFNEAREFARQLKLKTQSEWHDFAKSLKRPYDIPTNPRVIYQNNGWSGYGDWLGTGRIASQNFKYPSFDEARAYVRKLNLTSYNEWQAWKASGERPNFIVGNPSRTYKDKGWISFPDWMGYEGLSKNHTYWNFEEAREYVRSLNLKNLVEWYEARKKDSFPIGIPKNPAIYYKNAGWVNLGDWLGTGYISPQQRKYVSFAKARAFAQKQNFSSQILWREFAKGDKKPSTIPSNPDAVYRQKGWTSWGDFLGTDFVANQDKIFLSYEEAKSVVSSLNLTSVADWRKYRQTGQRQANIPANPNIKYADDGWISWNDFLSAPETRTFVDFAEATALVRSLGITTSIEYSKMARANALPKSLPKVPDNFYKNNGWVNWSEFLGVGRMDLKWSKYLPYEEAKKAIKPLNIKSSRSWRNFRKSVAMPSGVPADPPTFYRDFGWVSWADFLGRDEQS